MTFSLSPGQAHDAPERRKLLARMGPLDTRPARGTIPLVNRLSAAAISC